MGEVRGWVGLMGVYSSIKTTVKVVVTTEQRGDRSDQELLVSNTLLSTRDRARVLLYYAPVHVPTCSVPVPRHSIGCYWQSPGPMAFFQPFFDNLFQCNDEVYTCSDGPWPWWQMIIDWLLDIQYAYSHILPLLAITPPFQWPVLLPSSLSDIFLCTNT